MPQSRAVEASFGRVGNYLMLSSSLSAQLGPLLQQVEEYKGPAGIGQKTVLSGEEIRETGLGWLLIKEHVEKWQPNSGLGPSSHA